MTSSERGVAIENSAVSPSANANDITREATSAEIAILRAKKIINVCHKVHQGVDQRLCASVR